MPAYIAVADADGLCQLYLASELSAGVSPLALQSLTSLPPTCLAEVTLDCGQASHVVATLLRRRRRTALRLIHDYTHGSARMIVGTGSTWRSWPDLRRSNPKAP